jgi:hypothetical protein
MNDLVPVTGYEGLYSVTRDGRVWSHTSRRWRKLQKGKRGKGYIWLQLWKDDVGMAFYVHQLVAIEFISNPENKETVNHKDGDVENNFVENLEWLTHQEQQNHAWEEGLTNNHGERCGTAKLTNEQVDEIIALFKSSTKLSQQKVADMYGINQSQVSRILSGERRANQHKGKRHEAE